MPKQVTIGVGCYSSPKLNTTPSISLEYSVDLLTSFANCTEMDLIFGLNALLRTSDNIWNSSNARSLIKYCESKQYRISWELGNGMTKEKPQYVLLKNRMPLWFHCYSILIIHYKSFQNRPVCDITSGTVQTCMCDA